MTRESWNTRIGFILAAVGSAVGLGNIWRFPWMTADNGGSAFLVMYLLIILFVGVPGLLGVLVIGRRSKRNPVGALESLGSERWGYVGLFAVLTSMFLLTFYTVVGGWTVRYLVASPTGTYFADPAAYFGAVSFGPPAVAYHVVFLGLTAAIVFVGVRDGIELATKLMIPAIVVLLGGLAAWAVTLDGAGAGLDFYLSFDLAYLQNNFADVLGAAAGQALFTLSVGAGTMITYASYISEDRSLPFDGLSIAVLNTAVGFVAGIVVFPLLFTLGIDPGTEGGAGAVFISLAGGLARLPYGEGIGFVFFGVLVLAALSSSISMLEVPVSYLVDEKDISRRRATAGLFGIFLLTGSVSAMRPDVFGFIADTLVNLMLTAGLLGFLLFAGWVLGRDAIEEFEMGAGPLARAVSRPWLTAVAVLLPLFLGFTLISGMLGAVGISLGATVILAVTAVLGGATFIGLKRPRSA